MTKIPLSQLVDFPRDYAEHAQITPSTFVSVNSMRANRLGVNPQATLPLRSEVSRPYAHQEGDILLGAINPYLKKIHLVTQAGCHYHDVFCLRVRNPQQLHPAYLYHALCQDEFWNYVEQKADRSLIVRANLKAIANYAITVPSYAQQLRALELLEPLAQYRNLMYQEEQLRAQQQQYLLSQLFNLDPRTTSAAQRQAQHPLASVRALRDEQITVCTLQQVAQIMRNTNKLRHSDLEAHPGPYPVYSATIQNNGVLGYYDKFDYDGEYLTWIINGNNAGKFQVREGKFSVNQHAGVIQVDPQINLTYLCGLLNHISTQYLTPGTLLSRLSPAMVAQMRIALPPREVQDEIAHLLVHLDQLNQQSQTSSLGQTLEQLDTQLEYYRQQLLANAPARA